MKSFANGDLMLVLDGVWKSFTNVTVLRGISLSIAQGDALLLTGPSGAGKSTFLRLLYCAERADRGQVQIAGRSLSRLDTASVPYVRRNLGMVFQDFRLLPGRSAVQNVEVALEILGLPKKIVRERSLAMLDEVGLADRAEVKATALSGGEQQRVALARALVSEPLVILADEPTGSLDPERADEVLLILTRANRRGTTLVVATHDPAVVAFGTAHAWRHAHLVAGELSDLDAPMGRPARLDEDTDDFSTRARRDETLHARAKRMSA